MIFQELSNGGVIIVLDKTERDSFKGVIFKYKGLFEARWPGAWDRYKKENPTRNIFYMEANL